MNNYELLAPAGDIKSAYAAINAGADALYVGGEKFSARAYASNFDTESLINLIKFAHMFDVKTYLAVNTLIKESEFETLSKYLLSFYNEGLDGLIMQDLGAISFVRKKFPSYKIHASTQLTCTTLEEVKFLENIGVSRVVLSRELSLDEIRNIAKNCDIEIECFIHGALCYSYSGRCFMSSFLGNRSANRGRCAGPCRLKYECNNVKGHLLSLRDMQLISDINKLLEAGVFSLKIEGRMKKPEYVAGVVEIYKKAIDSIYNNKNVDYKYYSKKLNSLYNRGNKSTSYLHEKNSQNMVSIDSPSYKCDNTGEFELIKKKYIDKNRKLKIDGFFKVKKDKAAELEITYNDISIQVKSDVKAQISNNAPLLKDNVIKLISSIGNTVFEFDELKIEIDDNLFMQNKTLKDLRREAIRLLECKILDNYNSKNKLKIRKINNEVDCKGIKQTRDHNLFLSASFINFEQFEFMISQNFFEVLYPDYTMFLEDKNRFVELLKKAKEKNKKVFVGLPFIIRENTKGKLNDLLISLDKTLIDGYLCRDISEIFLLKNITSKEIITDYTIYNANRFAIEFIKEELGANKMCSNIEINRREYENLDCSNQEIVVYGKYVLMISQNCVDKTTNKCNKDGYTVQLQDRKNKILNVQKHCNFCYNIIRNFLPVCLFDYLDEIKNIGFYNQRFDFTFENQNEIKNILNCYNKNHAVSGDYTLGHYKKGVE